MYYIGLDIGSSSVKVALVESSTGKNVLTLKEPKEEMAILSLEKEWAEQDPKIWWQHVCNGLQRVIKESKIDSSSIRAVGLAYQMHGLVVVNKDGEPLRNAIIWCDSRAVTIGKNAFNDLGDDVCRERLLNSPGNFTASKLKWVKDNEPHIYREIYKYMLPGDFISFQLTGQMNTTSNGLSEGTLWDYSNNSLANWLLDYYGIDSSLTPDIVENFTDQGRITQKASQETGLPEGIPITYRAGDQPNNALTLGVLEPGQVAVTGGTSGVVYAVAERTSFDEIQKINHFAHVNYSATEPNIGRLLNINGAGIQYRWLLNNLESHSYEQMNEKAKTIAVGSDGLVILPFGNGAERMLGNRILGSHIKNIDFNRHSSAHFYRAALEGIAFSFVYGIEILQRDHTILDVVRAGNDNLFQSTIFSTTIATLIHKEIEIYNTTGAIGAARAASITSKTLENFKESVVNNDYVKSWLPHTDPAPYKRAYNHWKLELETELKNK